MKKKILLILITIISFMFFIPKANAIVMWMQCNEDGKISAKNNDKFNVYGTYAVINSKNSDHNKIRHLAYNKSNFYSGYFPVFFGYDDDDGQDIGDICWYNKWYEDDDGPISECDKEEDRIDYGKILDGYCPNGIYQTTGWDTSGAVKGDFLVGYGKKKAYSVEVLNEPILVIYGIRKTDNGVATEAIIEAYFSDGRYGYATTWEDFPSFADLLHFYKEDRDSDENLIDKYNFDDEFMNWTMMTQARRIGRAGRNYFKLLDTEESWLVGGREEQELKHVELSVKVKDKDGKEIKITEFRSDDDLNRGFGLWVKSWYYEYSDKLKEQIGIIKKFDSGDYSQLTKVSREISDKIDEGEEYIFDEDEYTPEKMVSDLKLAYSDLLNLIEAGEFGYKYRNNKCKIEDTTTDDPLESALSNFNCDIFKVSDLSKIKHGYHEKSLNSLILSILTDKIDSVLESEYSVADIKEKKIEYAKLLAKSANYIYKNIYFADDSIKRELETISTDLLSLAKDYGIELVFDCETLIGRDLIREINSYLDIIKIAIPIILIGFGIIDFTKAMFAGDESQMKKAQTDFIKRLAIAILIFFVPTIINILLSIANEVWNFIEPGNCGLF